MAESVSKVRVHGKAMSRTILGIVNAYLVMYPQTKADELRKAFPGKLTAKFEKFDTCTDPNNPRYDGSGLFHEIIELNGKRVWANGHEEVKDSNFLFEMPDETIHTADGKELAMESTWGEDDYKNMVSWAKQYGIEVASFEKHEGGAIKGHFSLEYLNGYVPPVAEPVVVEKKGLPKWLLAVAGLIILLLLFFLIRSCNKEPEVVQVEKVVTVTDTVTVVKVEKEIEAIEKNFNAAKFEQGKVDLTDDAKFVLHDLQKLMDKDEHKNVKLKIVGHTSAEGDAAFNQKLSENRAKAVVDFLVSQGISESRLSYEGKGSSEPLDANNPEVNRRTQIIVINE